MDKVRREIVNQVDLDTGEYIEQVRRETLPVGKEPNYYKVYIQDLANLQGLNPTETEVLQVLSANMTFDNLIVLIKPIKQKLVELIGKEFETIKKAIEGLTKKKILIRADRSVYRVNPKYAAKGKWEDIKALRLVIEYSENGREIKLENVNPYNITYSVSDQRPLIKLNDEIAENQIDLFDEIPEKSTSIPK